MRDAKELKSPHGTYKSLDQKVKYNVHIFEMEVSGLSVNGVQLHFHVPTHASVYLGVLSSHMQNSI